MKKEKHTDSAERLYKFFIYFVLIMLAITILVPVAWVFLASIKENSEFYGNPWTMPKGFYWQNFVDAWNMAKMGDYMINSVIVTALALALLLLVALPAAYCLARFQFRGSKFLNTLFMAGLFINVNYIVVPIFLMLKDGDVWLKKIAGQGFLLNNIVVLAVVYASTALPFTIYLLSGYFQTLAHDYEEAAYIDGAGYITTMWKITAVTFWQVLWLWTGLFPLSFLSVTLFRPKRDRRRKSTFPLMSGMCGITPESRIRKSSPGAKRLICWRMCTILRTLCL